VNIVGTPQLIKQLRNSNIYAECQCGCEFKLSDTILFDGTKPFPKDIEKIKNHYEGIFKSDLELLKKRINSATTRAETSATTTNIGKNFERIIPIMKDFRWNLSDSRFLGDPIDLIIFNGLINRNIDSITFIELKSGNSRLSSRQKSIKDAIYDNKVTYKEFK